MTRFAIIAALALCSSASYALPPLDNVLVSEGDSLSVKRSGNYVGMYAAARPTITVYGLAVGGSTVVTMAARAQGVVDKRPEVLTVLIGTNNLTVYGSPQAFLDKLYAYTDPMRALGIKVAVGTILPKYNPAWTTLQETTWTTDRAAVNVAIRQAAISGRIDDVIDFAADPVMGHDAAARDVTLYGDGTHPTALGQTRMAAIYTPRVDQLLASSLAWVPTASVGPIAPVASNFDINTELLTGNIPASASPDVSGAFRFTCEAGQLLKDDPIAYPNQPGASHLHQFFGNTEAKANSTYKSLRESGSSGCMSPLNRSAYWMPAMLDGKGNAVKPDYVTIYYKRRPANDPKCSLTSGDPRAEGNCVPLPNGLRMIFGYDMITQTPPTGKTYFNCIGQTARPGSYPTITAAAANCPTTRNPNGTFNKLGAIIVAPSCWDGRNLDSPNHRSHVAYAAYTGGNAVFRCPATHPFVIPQFTQGAWFTVDANLGTWRLSSDEMVPGVAPGTTFHADWFGAWDNNVQAMWTDNCINKLLNCSGGHLGNGKQLKQRVGFSWTANPRLVPAS